MFVMFHNTVISKRWFNNKQSSSKRVESKQADYLDIFEALSLQDYRIIWRSVTFVLS